MPEYQAPQTAEMTASVSKTVSQVGFWSAIFTTVWIIAFNLTVIVGASGIPVPATIVVGSAFLIAPFFVILMVSIHQYAPEGKKLWSQLGLSFAIIYAVIIGLNYFLQLTVVQQNPEEYFWLTMDFRADSAFWALEVFGYSFMSLAALFIIPIFMEGKIERGICWLFIVNALVNGVAAVAYLLTVNPLHVLVLASLGVWGITFPVATALLAMLFKRAKPVNE